MGRSKLVLPKSRERIVGGCGMKSKQTTKKQETNKGRVRPTLTVVKGKKSLKDSPVNKKKKIEAIIEPVQAPLSFEELILEHRENGRKLARSILRRWRVRMVSEEIDSIVDLTLCEAAGRYSPDKGASFMTFFFYHLRGNLVRAVTTAAQASNVFLACAQGIGLDTSDWTFTGDEELLSVLPDFSELGHKEVETPEQSAIKKERETLCTEACNKLDQLEREIVLRSFEDEESLVDIAKSLGYSRCHVSRVKKTALSRLKTIVKELMPEATFAADEEDADDTESMKRRRSRRKQPKVMKEPKKIAA